MSETLSYGDLNRYTRTRQLCRSLYVCNPSTAIVKSRKISACRGAVWAGYGTAGSGGLSGVESSAVFNRANDRAWIHQQQIILRPGPTWLEPPGAGTGQ